MADGSALKEPAQDTENHFGMTDAQWAQWQAYTHGYGEQDANGIDISLIRENLRFSPWKRLAKLQCNSSFFKEDRTDAKQVSDFQQVIAVLSAAGLRFVIVGGVAMRLQGSAHVTDDIDFAVARDPDNLEAIVKALAPYHPARRSAWPAVFLGGSHPAKHYEHHAANGFRQRRFVRRACRSRVI